MRSLLDINVLIALVDPHHIHHRRAHGWWGASSDRSWASCPLTENGFVRILSDPGYGGDPRSPVQLIADLQDFIAMSDHQFWPDDISLRDLSVFDPDHILGPRQLTDIYLLALAVRNGGKLVTFDKRISLSAARNATPDHLSVI